MTEDEVRKDNRISFLNLLTNHRDTREKLLRGEKYGYLNRQETIDIVNKIRIKTSNRIDKAISAVVVNRKIGFMINANIAGESIVFRNAHEFEVYCDCLESDDCKDFINTENYYPEIPMPGYISYAKLSTRIKFVNEILDRTSQEKFNVKGNTYKTRNMRFYKNIRYIIGNKEFYSLDSLKSYLIKLIDSYTNKIENPVKRSHLNRYRKTIMDGLDVY